MVRAKRSKFYFFLDCLTLTHQSRVLAPSFSIRDKNGANVRPCNPEELSAIGGPHRQPSREDRR